MKVKVEKGPKFEEVLHEAIRKLGEKETSDKQDTKTGGKKSG